MEENKLHRGGLTENSFLSFMHAAWTNRSILVYAKRYIGLEEEEEEMREREKGRKREWERERGFVREKERRRCKKRERESKRETACMKEKKIEI